MVAIEMEKRTTDELVTYFNNAVAEMNIPSSDKMALLGVITAIGYKCEKLSEDLRVCRNELCLHCGQYKTRHLGSCNGCRWDKAI